MAHPIVGGCVSVLKCVTPGCYWIRCSRCKGSSKIPESIRYKHYNSNYYPSQGEDVFVHDSDGFFYRGVICGRREVDHSSLWKYVVQLIDTFQVKDFGMYDVYPSFGEDHVGCESAHLICLLNVLPIYPPLVPLTPGKENNHNSFLEKVRNWDNCNHLIRDLMKNVSFQYEQLKTIQGLSFGKLTFETPTSKTVDFKDMLTSQNIAVIVTFRFEKWVDTLMSYPYICNTDRILPIRIPYVNKSRNVPSQPGKLLKNQSTITIRVYKNDEKLYKRLLTKQSICILFTKPPRDSDEVIRFVTNEGVVVMGTVLNPVVYFYAEKNDEKFEKFHSAAMLRDYFRQQGYSSCQSNYLAYSNVYFGSNEVPNSSDESDSSVSCGDVNTSLLNYDFDESLRKFTDEGGLLENFLSLPVSHPSFPSICATVRESLEILKVDYLREWQKGCLPSILAKKNCLIIGPMSLGKVTTSIISVLAWMKNVKCGYNVPIKRPRCLVFVPDYKRADRVAYLFKVLSKAKVLVTTSSLITDSQLKEAENGCNVLITTINNWHVLSGVNKCFGYNSFEHVLFDSFEKLHAIDSSKLEDIFSHVVNESKVREVQTVILSNVWDPFLIDYVNRLEKPTRCVVDIIQVSICYKLKPFVVLVSDDWHEKLELIILENSGATSLLLCKDYKQVKIIQERMNRSKNVLYVHEHLEKGRIAEIINQWESNKEMFLVSSDVVFNELNFTQNVELLVSWMINPCNRAILVQRFRALRGHQHQDTRKVSAYLFSDRESLDELTFTADVFAGASGCKFIGGDIKACISSAFKKREKLKENAICQHLLMFGKCNESLGCSDRHCFIPGDNVFSVDRGLFLKLELVECYNAFHLSVRVKDIVGNQERLNPVLDDFRSKLCEIKKGLRCAFEDKAKRTNQFYLNLKVGDVVGVNIMEDDEQILMRGKIAKIPTENELNGTKQSYEISFMDYEIPNEIVMSTNLFQLPIDVQSYPRDLVDIYVAGIAPSDFLSDWVHETSCFLKNYINLVNGNNSFCINYLAGIALVVVGRSIIVDDMYGYTTPLNDHSECIMAENSLKKLLIKTGYVVRNYQHMALLNDVAAESGRTGFLKIMDEEYGFKSDVPKGFNNAFVSAYVDPGLFYVQLIDERESFLDCEDRLNSVLNSSKRTLNIVAPGEMCAFKVDDAWNRAVILEINESDNNEDIESSKLIEVMFVDYGDTKLVHGTELFSLPDEFVLGMPYLAIECELVGIKSFDGVWTDAEDAFKKQIRNDDDEMLSLLIQFHGIIHEDRVAKCFRYQVALKNPDDQTGLSVNQYLVRQGLACWNDDTKHLLLPQNVDK